MLMALMFFTQPLDEVGPTPAARLRSGTTTRTTSCDAR